LISVTQDASGLNLVTQYGYDEVGNRNSQTDANQHTTLFEHDPMGRRSKRTLPAGQSESFTYDADGNLPSHADFKNKARTFQYDMMNHLTRFSLHPRWFMPKLRRASGSR
jgi:YD repeat-containing protein